MKSDVKKGPRLGMRHVQAVLVFLSMTVVYISRLNIGVALVAMTNANTTNPDYPEFDWNEKEISYILSSFFWGYILTQFLGGVLSSRFGTKLTMGISTLATTFLTLMIPTLVTWGGWKMFCGLRFVMGLFQGVLFPCIFQHLAKWSPLKERNRLCAVSLTGVDLGVVLAMGIPGLIAQGPMGWPGISYVSAALCLCWCVLWFIFSANNATESKFITETEKLYIESSMEHDDDFQKQKVAVPWKAIFTSVPFIALLFTRCTAGWGISTLQAQIPSYLHGVLGMDIKSNSLFSSLPFLVAWAMSYIFVIIADILQNRYDVGITFIRKLCNTIGFWIPATGLIAIGFLNKDNTSLAIAMMTLSVGANSGATIGSGLNTIDLSPNHAGILMGIVNTADNFMSVITPLVVGVVVSDTSNRVQWQIVFAIAAGIFLAGSVIYIILGSAHAQPWDAKDYLSSKDVEKSECNTKVDTCSVSSSYLSSSDKQLL